ncbi:MAG: YncE family protein, partial [Chloroflexi bacterium]
MTSVTRRFISSGLLAALLVWGSLQGLNALTAASHDLGLAVPNLRPVLRSSQFITTVVPLPAGVAPWPQAMAVDATLGLAYLAEGDRGTVTVVAGPVLVDVIPVGQQAADVAVDSETGFAYVAAPDPYALYSGHVAVIHGGKVVTQVVAGGYPGHVAVDPLHHRAYVSIQTGGLFDQVLVLRQDRLLAMVSAPVDIVALAVDPVRERAYVLNKTLPHLTTIDGTSIASPPVPVDEVGVPRDVAVDSRSGLVYVVGQSPFRSTGTVLVISDTLGVAARLPVGPDPRHVVADPEHGRVYVTNAGDGTVTVIAGTHVVDTIEVGPSPDAIAVDSARDRVYVSNAGDGTTSVLSGRRVVATLPAGGGPVAVDVEHGIAYLAGDDLAVALEDHVLGRVPAAAMPAQLAVNSETGLAYVCNQGAHSLSVLSDAEVLATQPLMGMPRAVAADPVSGRVYVAEDGPLTVVEGVTVQATLPITAHDIAVNPVRGLAYAAGNDLVVISGTQVLGTVDLGESPHDVAVNRVTGLAYASAGGREDGFVAVISGTQRIANVSTGGKPGKLAIDPVRDRVFVLHPEQGRLSVIEGTQRRFPSIFLP